MSERVLEQEIDNLKRRVALLEAKVSQPARGEKREKHPAQPQDNLTAWLQIKGLLAEPPPMAAVHARQWREIPEQEKLEILSELDHLPPGPMASDIIIENRR